MKKRICILFTGELLRVQEPVFPDGEGGVAVSQGAKAAVERSTVLFLAHNVRWILVASKSR